MKFFLAPLLSVLVAAPALAEGDIDAGKKAYNKCKSCHTVVDPEGEVLVKGGKTGPNLYGIAGRTAGTVEGYRYGDSLVAAGEQGLVWDEVSFTEYVQDPKAFLKSYLDDTSAKSKMTLRLKKGGEDVFAYLQSLTDQ